MLSIKEIDGQYILFPTSGKPLLQEHGEAFFPPHPHHIVSGGKCAAVLLANNYILISIDDIVIVTNN